MIDLYISGCNTDKPASYPTCYFGVGCSKWDMSDQLHTIEFITTKSNRAKLWNNINPGKIEEWDFPFDKKYYIDTTYTSGNTLLLTPVPGSHLASIRDETKIVVKSYKETLFGRPANKYKITITGYEYKPL